LDRFGHGLIGRSRRSKNEIPPEKYDQEYSE
jgi:hypothetical protein